AGPFKAAPDQRRAGKAKQPGNPGKRPKQQAARIARGQFFSPQSNAKLRARGKVFRKFDVQAAKYCNRLRSLRLHARTSLAVREMGREPRLFVGGNSLDALLRDQLLRARMKIFVHAAPPCPPAERVVMAPRSASSPR